MNEISSNFTAQNQKTFKPEQEVETAGTIAQNKPSPLFTTTSDSAGTIASNSSPTSGGGGFCMNA